MADLTDGQLAECRQVAREIVKEVLELHVASCPHHQAYLISKARVFGMFLGVIAASSVSNGVVMTVVMQIFKSNLGV